MIQLFPYVVGGLAVFMAMDVIPPATRLVSGWAPATPVHIAPVSNAARKSDRAVMLPASATPVEVTTVEVVGLRDAAIVYRDRAGRELFRTDPVSNVTVITKGVMLPKVTVRQNSGAVVRPMPIEVPREQAREQKAPTPGPAKLPFACEPSFSPVAQPSMAHHTGRCMADAQSNKLAG